MKRVEIIDALRQVREDRAKWSKAHREFQAGLDRVMNRLLHEAAITLLTVNDVAQAAGLTPKQVRSLMRRHGLNPKDGRNLLRRKAGEALAENAELLGIDPKHMDLTSPLAYLTAGEQMKRNLIHPKGITELDEDRIREEAEKATERFMDEYWGHLLMPLLRDEEESYQRYQCIKRSFRDGFLVARGANVDNL